MKRRFVQIDGELHEVVDGYFEPKTHMVQGEIQPYKSMITGEMITSRKQHRDHLKKHGMREVGNEVSYVSKQPDFDTSPQRRKELIRVQVDSMTDSRFRQALKKDIDFVKWNSRER
jgi:hypothetical protein